MRELTTPVGVIDVVDVSGLRIQADGKILVFADVYAKPVLFRLLANGDLDTSYVTDATIFSPGYFLSENAYVLLKSTGL